MDIKDLLQTAIYQAAHKAIADGVFADHELPQVILEVPPKKEFGDFATNFAMQAARGAKTNPRVIAEAIVERMNETWMEKAVIAGPGFINFYLKTDWLYTMLADVLTQGENYGNSQAGGKEKIQVEFVSANPTGPLHVGHGRGAAVGSALVNLLKAAGYDVASEYYINDAGNQIDNLAASVHARYLELLRQEVDFPENGYHGEDIIDTAKGIIDREGDAYLAFSVEERLTKFKEIALQEKLAALKADLASFNVYFDVWFSECTLHQNGALEKTCQVLKDNGSIYEHDGALWLKSTAYGDDKDRVVIRDNKIPTYLAADIAYHRNKLERGFKQLINIWGADHHGYICRVKAAIGSLGYSPEQLEVLIVQMVSLYRGGQLVKMSKRTGQSVTLTELIEEVGTDAARFFFIMRSLDSQLDFDLDLAKSTSNENPVYYIQYAYARIASIFRQATEDGITLGEIDYSKLNFLTTECEIDLIKKLGEYKEEIIDAAKERAPHRIARYVHDLAGQFHTFYNQCRIKGVDRDLQLARMGLALAVQTTIRHALNILGISAPEKM
ncbi:arginine--tRNA ligase [Pelosinus sp. UFO1]|uniref:arginine--tRNA ligase n=1 Tax=Pelosinus sp. UFO1 TaxID=484770 RepID=UPI0004D17331|nr:arginine--tRNA ligase [Pelosinus sp. UFO1]AIF50014.1 Arginyl-tRNA synthetase [Pelosinus sp. UFO1]